MGAQLCAPTGQPEAGTEALDITSTAGNSEQALKDAEALENQKQLSKEAFKKGMMKLLNLAIEGYPRAVRSTIARRNELLRETEGDQQKAEEIIKARAAAIKEEMKTWIIGLVPLVGFPATLLWPTWTLLRRVCNFAAVYGQDIYQEEVRAKIIHVFGGLRAVPATEFALEGALQLVWIAMAGPAAAIIPMGTIVGKVSNVEGHLMIALARETFEEGKCEVPKEVYEEKLDDEPTWKDYQDLAKDGTQYALVQVWATGEQAYQVALDPVKRDEMMKAAKAQLLNAQSVGRGAVAAAPDAAAAALEQAKITAKDVSAKGQELLEGLKGNNKKK